MNIMINEQKPKIKPRQHYIPQFYLKSFALPDNPRLLWLYERGSRHSKKVSIKDIACSKYYNVVETDEEERSNILDDYFGYVENKAAPVIESLKKTNRVLSDKELDCLLTFVATMVTRVPNFRDRINDFCKTIASYTTRATATNDRIMNSFIQWYKKEKGEDIPMPLDEFKEYLLDESRHRYVVHPNESVKVLLEVTPVIFKLLKQMKWEYLQAQGDLFFVTSDTPVIPFDPSPGIPDHLRVGGFGIRTIEVTFPLSPSLCMLGSYDGKSGYFVADKAIVKQVNWRTRCCANRFLFTSFHSKELDEIF